MPANWFWQPDKAWVNEINTTNYRTISGIRMATVFVGVGVVAFAWATYQALPWPLEPCTVAPCLEPLGRARAADFARSIYDSTGLFLAVVMGIALGGYLGKRLTDTEHVERKEAAKKAPIVNVTQERPAMRPIVAQPAVTVNANDRATVDVTAGQAPPPVDPDPAHTWAIGDPHEGDL